ncbi:MAG: SulP family inorganic anion transporter [Candidatus Neomarinimicrobiota bacterium]|nr:SulP family inorganic anion transporter [Candidatus Neomarinimicrobiota bacterium]
MTENSKYSNILPSLIAGLVNGIIIVVSAMALGALIFTGELSSYLPQGIGILLFGSLIFALFSAVTASYPIIISAPQDIPIAILALMTTTIIATSGSGWSSQEQYEFIFVTIGLTSILVGLFFYILGKFKLGKLVRFIPFPVVGGFLAGTGWLIVQFSFSMMTDVDLTINNLSTFFTSEMLIRWVPGAVFAVALLIIYHYISHYLLMPTILTIGIGLFYIVAFFNGISVSELESGGYLLGPFPEEGLFTGLPLKYLSGFDWNLFWVTLPAIGTMMILNAISVLFNYSGLELIIKQDVDLDRELKMTGFSNILAGLGGTPPGYLTLSETSMAYNIGARSRLSSIVVVLLCAFTLFFGANVLSIFPKVILGGLILNLGLSFLEEWLYDTWSKLTRNDYFVIVLILFVIAAVGFLEGIVIGLLMSIVLFVLSYSKVEVVKHELTGTTFHSNVERSEYLKRIITDHGEQISILPLQGFIFFGTANRLLDRVNERVENKEASHLKYLIFDFRHVTGLDSSTINSFNKLRIMANNHGFKVVFCSLNKDMTYQLRAGGILPDRRDVFVEFDDLDHGLERCEDELIEQYKNLDEELSDSKKADSFKDQFPGIVEFFEENKVARDTSIIEQGKDPGGIYFIESGRITVRLDIGSGEEIRLKSLGAGTVVGEVSLYLGSKASASVLTKTDCVIYFLSKDNFQKLNLESPGKAAELHTYIVKLLSDRLANSNATIQALMR